MSHIHHKKTLKELVIFTRHLNAIILSVSLPSTLQMITDKLQTSYSFFLLFLKKIICNSSKDRKLQNMYLFCLIFKEIICSSIKDHKFQILQMKICDFLKKKSVICLETINFRICNFFVFNLKK